MGPESGVLSQLPIRTRFAGGSSSAATIKQIPFIEDDRGKNWLAARRKYNQHFVRKLLKRPVPEVHLIPSLEIILPRICLEELAVTSPLSGILTILQVANFALFSNCGSADESLSKKLEQKWQQRKSLERRSTMDQTRPAIHFVRIHK